MVKTATAIIGLAVVSLLVSAPSWATTVLEQSFPDLVQKADTIVVGTVSAIESEWNAGTETPFTLVTFTDLDVLKGDHNQTTLSLRFLGGPQPDGTVLQVAGVPTFAVGERNVLFVTGNEHYAVPLVGMWQGVYRVVFDPKRDTDTVYTATMQPLTTLPTDSGRMLHDEDAEDQHTHPLRQPAPDPLSLDAFTDAIEREVQHD